MGPCFLKLKFPLAVALTLLAMLVFAAPKASADSISLTSNNLGIPGSIGTVSLTPSGVNQVTVSITMNPGFTIKLQGGDVFFNSSLGLNASNISGITIVAGGNTYTGLMDKMQFDKNASTFGKFGDRLLNFTNGPNGITSADKLTFVITASGLTVASLETANSQGLLFAVHFCDASGTNCGTNTGFATGGTISTVPEPGSMTLLGTGLVGIAGMIRRRLKR